MVMDDALTPPLILGINGSPYKDGHAANLLDQSLEAARGYGTLTELTHLVDHKLQPYDGRRNAIEPDYIKKLFKMMRAADGIIFSTPVYNYGPTDHMQSLLSHLCILEYQDYALEGMVAGFIAVCEEDGASAVLQRMTLTLNGMGCLIPPYCTLYHNKSMVKSEDDWQTTDIPLVGINVAKTAAFLMLADPEWGYKDQVMV